ncbi:mannose-1-phosphate guanylyltransferase [Mangrovibacterium diazotrophicum]|uniref:mannose-1-phosphate guanylyltransferase n=1 Tax=Mangrovibacterium diazotrophicum TaxID=1261403 RepID=A0A419VVR1_9BACT|nr:mannose-1-phosphate guanylyltransferase [Mangrovibacterium diazotrophicum]RKD86208.1 mannose-1-phosphate guanylyltransferase (GDP) [Mangrovibacterium diazotrophicum]
MNLNNYLVIMAGGIGSRFWPVSTAQKPKQFLDMLGTGRTLFQHTVDRFKGICPLENILVVTSENYTAIVKEQYPELLDGNILAEPCMRNTAPCIAYASYKIKKLNPNANIVVSPADHLIDEFDVFENTVQKGLDFTAANKAILTLGILPHKPETGYGYIQTSDKNAEIASVKAFKEKPDLDTAKKYLADGGYYWNAGIFFWSVSTIIEAFEKYNPTLASTFEKGLEYFYTEKEGEYINEVFPACENISIDYSILEKADNLFVEKATFSWSDLGTWGSLWEKSEKPANGNSAASSKAKFYESKNNLVHTSTIKKVVVQGLEDYIIVEANGTLLICSKQEEQRIKQFLNDMQS